jgi:predicted nucleic acid-binding protein
VILLTGNGQTAEKYALINKELMQNETPIPTNDMWIAVLAIQLEVWVFTYDSHF